MGSVIGHVPNKFLHEVVLLRRDAWARSCLPRLPEAGVRIRK
jgi:hypothetical protein